MGVSIINSLERETEVPSRIRVVEIKLPEAELLADLYSIVSDLRSAEEFCAKAIELETSTPRDLAVEEGLASAAVIRYGRCFTTGVRLRLNRDDLVGLSTEDLAEHDHFYALRDKFVAHSISPFEETYVTASAHERDGEKLPITSIGPGHYKVLLEASTARALSALIGKVKNEVNRRVATEERKLLEFIQTLPIEAIHAGDLHSPRPIQPADVHKTRRQRQISNKSLQVRRAKTRAP
jgi:hypothetical protein